MSALVRHTVSEPQRPLWKNLLYVVVIVLGVNLSVELTNHLPRGMAGVVSITILVLAAVFSSYLINRKLAQYTYILIEDELIFYKQIGKKESKVLDIKLQDLEWIKPIKKLTKAIKCKKVYSLSCKLKGEDIYVGQFHRDGKTYRFIFQPNEGLFNAIQKQIKAVNL